MTDTQKTWTVPMLAAARAEGRKLVMLTCYDASFARVLDDNGCDLILIGDSLGMVVQGREDAGAAKLREEALAVAEAGATLLVLEGVPASLAETITAASPIPTIGIGAGAGCDGQVLVLHDLLGLDTGHRRPKFVKDFLAEGGSVAGAVRAFADAVRIGSFPTPEHSYS